MSERDLEAIAAGVAAYAMCDDDGPRSPPRLDGSGSASSPKGGSKNRKRFVKKGQPGAPAQVDPRARQAGRGKGKAALAKGYGPGGLPGAPIAFPGGLPPMGMPGMPPMPGMMPGFPFLPGMLELLAKGKGKGKGGKGKGGKGGKGDAMFPPGFPMMPGMPGMGMPPALDRHTLKTKIRTQIEYYFSKENLLKDVYLRQQMDEEGWVPLETLAGFTRLKTLLLCTNDPTLLMIALVESERVDVDVANKKVRAKDNHEMWLLPHGSPGSPGSPGSLAANPASPGGPPSPTALPASPPGLPMAGAPPGL